jgi:hypothetical protein
VCHGWWGKGPEFVVLSAAATVVQPVHEIIRLSTQVHHYFQPPLVDGTRILQPLDGTSDPLLSLLIDDMGQNGRALELLQEQLRAHGCYDSTTDRYSTAQCTDLSALADDIRAGLIAKYGNFEELQAVKGPLLRAVLGQRQFRGWDDLLVPNSEWTVERVCSFGLVRFVPGRRTLSMPYVLLWLMARDEAAGVGGDHLLSAFAFNDYREQRHRHNSAAAASSGAGLTTWQSFEDVVANFRALRSHLYAGQTVSLAQFHYGARFDPALGDPRAIQLPIVAAEAVIQARGRYEFDSTTGFYLGPLVKGRRSTVADLQYECGTGAARVQQPTGATVDIRAGSWVVKNGYGASADDVFVCQSLQRKLCAAATRYSLLMVCWNCDCPSDCRAPRSPPVLGLEAMQARSLSPKSGSVTNVEFERECRKAVGDSHPANLFLLLTGVETDVFVGPNRAHSTPSSVSRPIAGIVDAHNWADYWGPFAARAFLPVRRPDIN